MFSENRKSGITIQFPQRERARQLLLFALTLHLEAQVQTSSPSLLPGAYPVYLFAPGPTRQKQEVVPPSLKLRAQLLVVFLQHESTPNVTAKALSREKLVQNISVRWLALFTLPPAHDPVKLLRSLDDTPPVSSVEQLLSSSGLPLISFPATST